MYFFLDSGGFSEKLCGEGKDFDKTMYYNDDFSLLKASASFICDLPDVYLSSIPLKTNAMTRGHWSTNRSRSKRSLPSKG